MLFPALCSPRKHAVARAAFLLWTLPAVCSVAKAQTATNPTPVDLGSQAVGVASLQTAVTFQVTGSGTLPALSNNNVLTLGAPNFDFTLGTGSTCRGAVASGASCTVNIIFTPRAPGQRLGAVALLNGSGQTVATALLSGLGTGAAAVFPGNRQPVPLGSGFAKPADVAVDGAGNVYVVDPTQSWVTEIVAVDGAIPASNPTMRRLGSNFDQPSGVAIDGAGNIYVADLGNNAIKEIVAVGGAIPATNPTILTLISGNYYPSDVAVDGLGNVYFPDPSQFVVSKVVARNGTIPTNPTVQGFVGGGFNSPSGVAVDRAGNIYVASTYPSFVKQIAPDGTTQTFGQEFDSPTGVALDGAGNVYVTEPYTGQVKEILAVGGTIPASNAVILTLGTGFSGPQGVAVDGAGNVYVADYAGATVKQIPNATPPTLSFSQTPVGSISSDSPQSLLVHNVGTAALNFGIPESGTNPALSSRNYSLGGSSTCPQVTSGSSAQGTLAPGATCTAVVSFSPIQVVSTAATLTFTDNALTSTQTISLTGTATTASGTNAQTITFPQPASPVQAGTQTTLSATATSSLPVLYSVVSGPAVVSGATVTYTGSGTVVLQAAQNGNNTYAAATPVQRNVVVQSQVGVSTGTQTATVTIANAGTLGAIYVLTSGQANLDYTFAPGGTCATGTAYAANATCTVNYTFTPRAPGQRNGAVQLVSTDQITVLGTTLLSSMATGPTATFPGNTAVVQLDSQSYANGVAADAAGNVYVADTFNNRVKKIVAVGGVIPTLRPIQSVGSGYSQPYAVAVDGAGNVYVAEFATNAVKEVLAVGGQIPASPTIRTLYSGSSTIYPSGIAVDGAGNVFFADVVNNAVSEIIAVGGSIPASGATVRGLGSGFVQPRNLALDSSGNLFVADSGDGQVKEILAVDGVIPATNATVRTLSSAFQQPFGVAVDPAGNVYVADFGGSTVSEILAVNGTIPASNSTVRTLLNFTRPTTVAVDSAGNIYVANYTQGINEVQRVAPPSLAFAQTAVGATSSDSPKTVELQNTGNGALLFPAPNAGTNPSVALNFSLATGAGTCPQVATGGAAGSVAAGASCNQSISFTPTTAGNIAGSVILMDNSSTGSQQTISVSGSAVKGTAAITFNVPAHTYGDAPFSVSASSSSTGAFTYSVVSGPATVSGSTVTLTGGGTVVLQASQAADPNYVANTEQASFNVVAFPDLTIAIQQTDQVYQIGTEGYTFTVTNSGGAATTATSSLQMAFPSDFVPYSIDSTQAANWTCTGYTACTNTSPMAAGEVATFVVYGDISTSATSYSVSATVSGGGESNTGNDTTSLVTPLTQTIFVVNRTADPASGTAMNCATGNSNTCALRDAIAAVNAGTAGQQYRVLFDPVQFAGATTFALTNGPLVLNSQSSDVQLKGNGQAITTVSGGDTQQILSTTVGVRTNLALRDLSLVHGFSNTGGGALSVPKGAITGTNVTFANNASDGDGGAILQMESVAQIQLSFATFRNNTATRGAAIFSQTDLYCHGCLFQSNIGVTDGAVHMRGSAYVFSSTLSGNTAQTSAALAAGTLYVLNSTFTGNISQNAGGSAITTTYGGRIENNTIYGNAGGGVNSAQPLTGLDNIIANNLQNGFVVDCVQNCPTDPSNLTSTATGTFLLLPLGNYGGPVPTMPVLPGSAGYRSSSQSNNNYDERNNPRPTSGANTIDAGAVQTNYTAQWSTQPPSSVMQGQGFTAGITLQESGQTVTPPTAAMANIPVTLTGQGTLSNAAFTSVSTAGILANGSFAVDTVASGDTLTALGEASAAFSVTPSVDTLAFTASPATSVTSGGTAGTVKVSAENSAGAVATGATNPVTLLVTYPDATTQSYQVTPVAGVADFTSALASVPLSAAGVYTYRASTAANGATVQSAAVTETVQAGAVASLRVAGFPGTIALSQAGSVTVTALDAAGNVVPGYVGQVQLSSSDPTATLGTAYTFTANDAGQHGFTVRLNRAGAQSITATDTASSTVTGSETGITVSAGSVTLTGSSIAQTYGQTSSETITVTGVAGGPVPSGSLVYAFDGGSTATASLTAGASNATATLAVPSSLGATAHTLAVSFVATDANYANSASATTFTWTTAKAQLTVLTDGKTATYGDPIPTLTGSLSGVVNNDAITATFATVATSASAVGSYPISATLHDPNGQLSNYQVTNSGNTLAIGKAPLSVTADGKTKVYNEPVPTLTGTVSGVLNGDSITATYSTTATSSSPVGAYPITATLLDPSNKLGNYQIINSGNTLTVTAAAAAITFAVGNHTYGDAPFSVSASSASTGAFTYTVVSGPATISGSMVTLTGAGTVVLQASQAADANYIAKTQQINFAIGKSTAAITFAVGSHTYGDAPFTVSASSSSTGAFTYTVVSGPGTISGSTVTLTGAGTIVLQAYQATDGNYVANMQQTSSTVGKSTAVITFTVGNHTYGDASFTVAATSSSTGAFTYSVVSGPATISGNTVTLTGVGTVLLQASQAADNNYAANPKNATFTVAQGTAAITLSSLTATYDGNPHAATATTTPAGLNVTFTYSGSATAPSAVGNYAVVATVNDRNYTGSATGTLVIATATAAITFAVPNHTYGDTAFPVSASSSSTGAFTYSVISGPATVSGSTVTVTGAGMVVLQASQAADANYAANAKQASFTVAKTGQATATISPIIATYGAAATATITISSTGGVAATGSVQYSFDNGSVLSAPVKNGSATITVPATLNGGSHMVSVTYSGDGNYGGGTGQQTFTVAQLSTPPVVNIAPIATHTYGDAPFTVSATSPSTGAFTYTVLSGPVTISGSTVTLTGAGAVVLRASQAADANYKATSATTSFQVNMAAGPALTFAPIATHTYGDAAFTVSSSSASTGAITYSVVSGPALISGNTVTLTGAGTVVLLASQAADTNYKGSSATISFQVNMAAGQALTFAPIAAHTYGDAAFTVSASSASTGTITYSVASGPATITGNMVTPTGAGTVIMQASQAADANYAATTKTASLTVSPAVTVLTFPQPAPIVYGTALGVAQLNSSAWASGLGAVAGTFLYSPATGALLNAGTTTLNAQFTPSNLVNFTTPAAVTTKLTVMQAQTLTVVTTSASPVLEKVPVTFTAGVTTTAGGTVPEGTVTFSDAGSVLGTATLNASGFATYTASFTGAGNHTITAAYSGNANQAASSGTVTQLMGTAATLMLTDGGQSNFAITVQRGLAAHTTVTLTPGATFTGTVSFSCSGLPANVSCEFTPASVSLAQGSAAQSIGLQIRTASLQTASLQTHTMDETLHSRLALAFALPGMLVAGIGARSRRLRGLRGLLLAVVCIAGLSALASLTGCGAGYRPPYTVTNAAPGTYTFNVVATSGGNTATLPVSLTIQ